MIIVKTRDKLTELIAKKRNNTTKIGFIPTMGALHEGHLLLLRNSKENQLFSVCSIFINPTQFNDKADFEQYPVTIEQDITLLEKAGCDVLFLPSVAEMYPDEEKDAIKISFNDLDSVFEGQYRPGHFQGVCTIVNKLLRIVLPDYLFLGQKDYQQCMVIQRMIEQTVYTISPNLIIVPTKREVSGLALSSRNKRLTEKEREESTAIYHTLQYIKDHYTKISKSKLIDDASAILHNAGFEKIDYIGIADAKTLNEVVDPATYSGSMIVLIAAFKNKVRLIDNIILS